MLKFPDEEVATLELVHRTTELTVQVGTGFSHLVVQVDDLAGTVESLSCAGLGPVPCSVPAARKVHRHRGSRIPTAIGSSSCNGRTGTRTASPQPTSPRP